MGRVVLVTGAARHLGGQMVKALSRDPNVERVVGVDVVPPRRPVPASEFIRADIRNPVIGKVLQATEADTVVHMGVIATSVQAGGRASMKEINVIGTMQLLAACQKAPALRQLVVKSTSSVYGAGPSDPALFTEDMSPKHPPTSGWAKDSVEVEGFVRGFARRRPDVAVSILRLANFIGPKVETAMTEYFSLPLVPTVLGFDARMQFIHEDDGIEALRQAALQGEPGVFNIAGNGVLSLSQAVRRTGRPSISVPGVLLPAMGRALAPARLVDFSKEQVRFLTYGRGIDTTRATQTLGFTAAHSTASAFADFLDGHGLGPSLAETVFDGADTAVRALSGGAHA
ncbi:MAG: NAD-dependent epimerase/dehydratase family protein [Candidatus Nanopelagicales bacterium]